MTFSLPFTFSTRPCPRVFCVFADSFISEYNVEVFSQLRLPIFFPNRENAEDFILHIQAMSNSFRPQFEPEYNNLPDSVFTDISDIENDIERVRFEQRWNLPLFAALISDQLNFNDAMEYLNRIQKLQAEHYYFPLLESEAELETNQIRYYNSGGLKTNSIEGFVNNGFKIWTKETHLELVKAWSIFPR